MLMYNTEKMLPEGTLCTLDSDVQPSFDLVEDLLCRTTWDMNQGLTDFAQCGLRFS